MGAKKEDESQMLSQPRYSCPTSILLQSVKTIHKKLWVIWSFCWTLILTQFSPKWSRAVFGIYHHTKSENDIPKNFGALDCKHNQLHNPSLRGGITKSHWTDVSNFHFTKAKLKAKANSLLVNILHLPYFCFLEQDRHFMLIAWCEITRCGDFYILSHSVYSWLNNQH